jgi:two-component system sensor histidine kinase/response regulator
MPEELLARVSAQVGLKQTRDRLERVARERQELVTLVAHDLKNPLTSVLFASDVLRSGGARPERVPRYLQMIHESAQDALGYIRRYLETQAAQARGTDDRQDDGTCVAWQELLDWLHDRYALQLEARGLQLNIATPETDASAAMDGVVLRQVVENLVTNAMKYAPGGDVDLSLRNGSPGYWQLHVEDRGPGIPAAHRTQLFMPFMRLQEGDDPLSSGLGLSLARQILEGAGGSLWYEDRDGGGARFVVEVPAASETSIRAVG